MPLRKFKHNLLSLLGAALAILCTLPAQAKDFPLKALSGDSFIVDLQYATEHNFLKKNVYKEFGVDKCWVHPDLEALLQKLIPRLKEQKLKLVFWDCYRPLAVQKAMWKLVPDARFVANPKSGSNHNRGIAIDISLANEDGSYLEMPTPFDDFSAKAAPTYACAAAEKVRCANRDRLVQLMGEVGLKPLSTEWWHYQLPASKHYPILENLDGANP